MKYRNLLFASVFVFAFLFSLTVGVIVYSQRERPKEDRGTPACSIQIESSGRRTAFLDCTNWGTIYGSQVCTPTHPSLQTKQLFEVFPSGRQNCEFQPRNDCVSNKTASYGWSCEDGQDPITGTETKSIVCPVSCTKYCPNPATSKPCRQATWDTTYCEWNISRCNDIGCNECESFGLEDSVICLTTNNLEDTGCCSNFEASQCSLNGGIWYEPTCTCISPIIIDVAGNGFKLFHRESNKKFLTHYVNRHNVSDNQQQSTVV